MKRTLFILIMLGIVSLAVANPLPSIYVNKFWINGDGDLTLKFSDFMSEQTALVDLYDGTNHFVNTIDFSSVPNLLVVYPEAAVSALQGYFMVTINQMTDSIEEVHWGSELTNDISSLATGECGMQAYVSDGFDSTVVRWVKELDLYPNSQWWPVAHSNIDVSVVDTFGNPIADYPVYVWFEIVPWDYTNETGHMLGEVFSSKLHIVVKHPQTQEAFCDTTFFSEPGQTYSINAQFNDSEANDLLTPGIRGNLHIYPNVLRRNEQSLHLSYDGKLQANSRAELFDLKGRLVARQDFIDSGMDWQLPKLTSGVYFVHLVSGKHSLGSSKLIILK